MWEMIHHAQKAEQDAQNVARQLKKTYKMVSKLKEEIKRYIGDVQASHQERMGETTQDGQKGEQQLKKEDETLSKLKESKRFSDRELVIKMDKVLKGLEGAVKEGGRFQSDTDAVLHRMAYFASPSLAESQKVLVSLKQLHMQLKGLEGRFISAQFLYHVQKIGHPKTKQEEELEKKEAEVEKQIELMIQKAKEQEQLEEKVSSTLSSWQQELETYFHVPDRYTFHQFVASWLEKLKELENNLNDNERLRTQLLGELLEIEGTKLVVLQTKSKVLSDTLEKLRKEYSFLQSTFDTKGGLQNVRQETIKKMGEMIPDAEKVEDQLKKAYKTVSKLKTKTKKYIGDIQVSHQEQIKKMGETTQDAKRDEQHLKKKDEALPKLEEEIERLTGRELVAKTDQVLKDLEEAVNQGRGLQRDTDAELHDIQNSALSSVTESLKLLDGLKKLDEGVSDMERKFVSAKVQMDWDKEKENKPVIQERKLEEEAEEKKEAELEKRIEVVIQKAKEQKLLQEKLSSTLSSWKHVLEMYFS